MALGATPSLNTTGASATALPAGVVRVLAPLDRLRREVLAVAVRAPWLRALCLDREARVASLLLAHATFAFLGALFFPVFLLVVGPVLVGLPHLAADVRHLLVRRRWPDGARSLGWLALLTLAVLPVAGARDVTLTRASATVVLALGVVAVCRRAGSGDPREATSRRDVLCGAPLRFLACLVLGTVAATAWVKPTSLQLGLVHAHNLVPWVLLGLWWGGPRRLFWGLALLVTGASLVLASGVAAHVTLQSPLAAWGPTHVLVWADGLAPGLRVERAVGVTTSFAFLQSTHYALWLIGLPELDRERRAPTTVLSRVKAYVGDLGPAGAGLVLAAALALLGFALLGGWTRAAQTYLRWAGFHGWWELGVLSLWLAGGRR